jgi:ribosomal protein L9
MLLILLKKAPLGDEERMKKVEALNELEHSTLLEEVSWRKKSRASWLSKGDKCTQFFHKIANSNRIRNLIDSLLIGDSISANHLEISKNNIHFYKKIDLC